MKKTLLTLLLACCFLLACQGERGPAHEKLPSGISMGMSMEEAAVITGGTVSGCIIDTGNALYIFGAHGLAGMIVQNNG